MNFSENIFNQSKCSPVVYVRITTSFFVDSYNVIRFNKSLRVLKRKSDDGAAGYFIDVMNECLNCSLNIITNFHECGDGIYRVTVTNENRDFETGIIDDWDYVLVKVEESLDEIPNIKKNTKNEN